MPDVHHPQALKASVTAGPKLNLFEQCVPWTGGLGQSTNEHQERRAAPKVREDFQGQHKTWARGIKDATW